MLETEYRDQQFYYEDSDGQLRCGYDTEAELQAGFTFFHHKYKPQDFGQFTTQYKPKPWQKIVMRLMVCASAVLFVLAIWIAAAAWFGFRLIN